MIRVDVIGPTVVTAKVSTVGSSNLGGAKPRQLLEMLALSAGRSVPKESLAEQLWEGEPPRSYIATLESYVCVVRRRLAEISGEPAPVITTTGGYRLDEDRVQVDVVEVRRRLASRDPREVAGTLSVDSGSPLADEPYAAWAVRERESFASLASDAYLEASRRARRRGDPHLAVALARAASRQGRWSESATQELMRALEAVGDVGQALVAYQQLRTLMRDELGVEPGRASQELHLQLLRRDRGDDTDALTVLLGRVRALLDSDAPHTAVESTTMAEVGRLLLARS